MKITVEREGCDTIVFDKATDAFLAVRYPEIHSDGENVVHVMQTESHSWCGGIREILKEIRQAGVELQRELTIQQAEEHSDDSPGRVR